MTNQDTKARGPGQSGQGKREGFSFGEPRGGGREGGRDGRRGGGGGRDRREGGSSASYRVVNELSALEKALTKADFGAMKGPLSEVLKAVRPLRLQSLENLDQNTRGKLITSLMRVMRLPKPKEEAVAVADAPPAEEGAIAAEQPTAEAPASEAPASEAPASEEAAPAEAAAPLEAAAPADPPSAPAESKVTQWSHAQFTVGLIWSAVGDRERAQVAFDGSGRQPAEADLTAPAAPDRVERKDRGARPERPERGDRRDRGAAPRPERGPRRPVERQEPFQSSGDWKVDVQKLEEMGRTRDAARIHEKNGSFADASRLYEVGTDLKSALRTAALGKLDERIAELTPKLKPEETIEAFERAQAWEKLMELFVARQDYESIAKLYERAAQFDQAALAWERAQKYALARKAYERAKDFGAANRVRELEVKKLIERGDRLGAATILMTVGRKAEAIEALKQLPGPKTFHFMQKLKLLAEATAFAKEELAKAEQSSNPMQKARWLELLGDQKAAIEVYLGLGRKDKAALVLADLGDLKPAAELFEQAGQLDKAAELFAKAGDMANAERVKALPRPAPAPEVAEEAEPAPAATDEELPPPPESPEPPQASPAGPQ